MWSSRNSIFSFFRAWAFCNRTIRSTNTALSTSGKLSTTTTDEADWFSGERSSVLLPRALREPETQREKKMSPKNTPRKTGNKVSPNALKWQSHHMENNNQLHTADGNHSHQEYKTRKLQEAHERHRAWQAKWKEDRGRISNSFWTFSIMKAVLRLLEAEHKGTVYLMNWSDCPCCCPPDHSLHFPPAPASCVLLQRKRQYLKNTHLRNLHTFLLRISFGEQEYSLPSQDTDPRHDLKIFNQ